MTVTHFALVTLKAIKDITWVILITHIAHTLMSDELLQGYNTFSAYQPFNF